MKIDQDLTSYADPEFSAFLRRSFLASAGYDSADLERPIVGIVDTSSDFNTCHRQLPEVVSAVKRGVLEAGGLPFAFPTASLAETFLSPTSMLYRNLVAMETEEMLRAQPMDAAVLVGGCDKTVPAQLMAAASANIPALIVVAGPMNTGSWRGVRLGACTDCRTFWSEHRAGKYDAHEIGEVRQNLATTAGTCAVMGTASTMACVTEALGMMVLGGATAPATTGARLRHATVSGRTAVALAHSGRRPADVLTRESFLNALAVLAAVSGSTNAVIHLLAVAGRAGVRLTLDDFDDVARRVPLLVDCKPAGSRYMQDFHDAGGVPALLKVLEPALDLSTARVDSGTLGDALRSIDLPGAWQTCIRTLEDPLGPAETLTVLHGNLAPDGAVLKAAAASKHLLTHRGPALVFETPDDAAQRLDDPALDVTPDHVLILRNAGPAAAGMPESGALPIPRKLATRGVKDMVRISDARMSGTAFGTVVLHCSPEAARGGPLSRLRDGDVVSLDVPKRRIDVLVDEREWGGRTPAPPPPTAQRGWRRLYEEHVQGAHLGADLDFLVRPR